MPRGRPVQPVVLTGEEKAQLVSLANSRSLPHGLVRRAQIVLACAARTPPLPGACTCTRPRSPTGARYLRSGIAGLHDELGRGRPRRMQMTGWPRRSTPRCTPNRATGPRIGAS